MTVHINAEALSVIRIVGRPKMHVMLWINAPLIACAAIELIDIKVTKLVIFKVLIRDI